MATLGILKSDREVVRLITCRLSSEFYDVEQRTTLIRHGITRSEMEEIVRASHANRKTKALEEWKLAAVLSATAPSVDPHALAVGCRFQANNKGGRFGGPGHQQPQRQRQFGGARQHPQQQNSMVVLDSSSLSISDSLVVLDSSRSNSYRDSMVVLDSSSLSSSIGSTVVSGNSSSAGSEVSTTTNPSPAAAAATTCGDWLG